MKRTWHHPAENNTGRRYWRSTAELERRADFLNKLGVEFPNGDTLTEEEQENSRRDFLKVMGGAAGLMGLTLTSCRRPLVNILPYTKHLEWIVPGKPLLYASAMPRVNGGVQPLVVTTHEGRPTHLAGNPLHPAAGGGVDVFSQASILDLYDPERSKAPASRGDVKRADWKKVGQFFEKFARSAKDNGGQGVALLSGDSVSPTVKRLQGEIAKALPKLKFYSYEAISRDAQKAANAALFGAGAQPVVNLSKALRVFSLDCDFLGLDPVGTDTTREFMANRDADKGADGMNRLYVLENRYTLTGGMADHRKPMAASLIPAAAAFLAAELGEGVGAHLAATLPEDIKVWIKEAAADLKAFSGKALVLCGSRCGGEVHALVAAANQKLGAFGPVVEIVQADAAPEAGSIADLVEGVKTGGIHTIFSLTQSDPLYDAPGAADLKKLFGEKKTTVVHWGHLVNATGRQASLHIPSATGLEAWGDVRSPDGTYSVIQPMIQPLYDGASEIDVLLAILGRKKLGPVEAPKADPAAPPPAPVDDAAYTAVRETFAAIAGSLDEVKWNHTLRDGYLKGSVYAKGGAFNAGAVGGIMSHAKAGAAPTKESMEVVLVPDASVWDGRFAGNAWLQEAPDPITKITWDNAAWIGSKTFRELGLKEGQKVKIKAGDVEIPEIAVIEAPGHVSNSITIPLGYGQNKIGTVGTRRGFNAYPLRKDAAQFVLGGAKIEPLDDIYTLAITQEHNTMEGRAIFREGTAEEYKKAPNFAQVTGMDSHIPENISLYKGQMGRKTATNPEGFDYETRHQWGMTIDLNKCIGCASCLVACQSENNIPVVGKDQVQKGRAMHWIRMDRYFATHEWGGKKADRDHVMIAPTAEQLEGAEMVMQPVACQQCESAPCETVCPVNATVHTEEGLNAMAYNRCIGTRYCANNCPYTARRFNWFDYNKRNPLIKTKLDLGVAEIETRNLYAGPFGEKSQTETVALQKNPNVTVRMRGVIEKCTYCVQRLEAAKINQKILQRDSKNFRIPTDSVKVACQQACPAGAIEFGDIANQDSAVVKMKASPRNYEMLKYIGTRPRTSYLARIRNVNTKMPGHEKIAAWSSKQF